MALSNQVKGSLDEAGRHLRDALAFAARTEHPVTINAITELMCRLDSLEKIDMIIEKFDTNHEVPHPFRGWTPRKILYKINERISLYQK